MSFVPAHTIHCESERPRHAALILHGIFGSRRNWRTFANGLAAAHPSVAFVTVDLRFHGDSKDAPGEPTLDAAAADLVTLARTLKAPLRSVMGHSFGGKVALTLASTTALEDVFVLDCPVGPKEGDENPSDSEVGRVIAFLLEHPAPYARRTVASELLQKAGFSRAIAGWMGTNLERDDHGTFSWRFDEVGIKGLLSDYWKRDFYPALESGSLAGSPRVHCVVAEQSDRFTPEDFARLTALDGKHGVVVETLPDAGHWLHVDNPEGLLRLVSPAFERASR